MGVYTENIFNLSLNDLVRNIKSLEMKVADDEKKIKRYEKRDEAVSYTHLRAHETTLHLVCRLLLEKKNRR